MTQLKKVLGLSVLGLLAIAFLLAIGVGGNWLWLRYNPFWDRTREYHEANELAATIHQRPLTAAEFTRSLALCEAGPIQSRSAGVSIVEEALKQDSRRGAGAVEVLTRVSQSSDADLAAYAASVLRRAKNARPGNVPDAAPIEDSGHARLDSQGIAPSRGTPGRIPQRGPLDCGGRQ